jgi:hypothetical protein
MSELLFLPTFLSSPLLNETITVRLDERLVLIIVWFQKERYTYHGESNRTRRIRERISEDFLDSPV